MFIMFSIAPKTTSISYIENIASSKSNEKTIYEISQTFWTTKSKDLNRTLALCPPVWPDVEIKSSQIFPKDARKVAKTVSSLKGTTLLKITQKVAKSLGHFGKKMCLLEIDPI